MRILGKKMARYMGQLMAAGLAISLTACATERAPLKLSTVGPEPAAQPNDDVNGSLIVFSDWTTDAYLNRHAPYEIASADGKVKPIQNSGNIYEGGPTLVSLVPGAYEVRSPAASFGSVVVPVRVEAGRTTFVYLDGYTHVKKSQTAATDMVTLPNGNVAGWAYNVK